LTALIENSCASADEKKFCFFELFREANSGPANVNFRREKGLAIGKARRHIASPKRLILWLT
jgi:hypothetical protein